MGGVTRRVLCTWQLLGLAAKGPWLAPGGTGGGGWGHPQGAVHMAAARLGCKRTVVGTGWDRGRWVGSPAGCCAHGSC